MFAPREQEHQSTPNQELLCGRIPCAQASGVAPPQPQAAATRGTGEEAERPGRMHARTSDTENMSVKLSLRL